MMNFKKLLPYIIAIVAFVFVGYAYAPYTLEGRVVNQSDISSWNGMAHEIVEWNDAHPDNPTYWTNSMFGGMPATTISVKYHGDLTKYLYDLLFVGQRPASYLIISMIGAFLMFLAFGVNIWLAIFGAIAVTFCSYNMQIILVGHNTKMIAIAFMPWVMAALVWAYRKSMFWGAVLFGFALSFQIKANHPQISYYLAIIIFGYIIWQLLKSVKEKSSGKFLRTSLCVLVAGLLGIAANINHLWPTYEYGKHTMRGGSELVDTTSANAETRKGLDLEYATRWSYGIDETPNIFIPNFNGGASVGSLGTKSAVYKTLTEKFNYPDYEAESAVQALPLYWGPQDFTAGPMYMGAVCVFLFILGLFIIRSGAKWWLLGVSLLAIILGWGYHFMAPTKFFFNNIPLYSKFRTVSMILVILQLTIPTLAVLALDSVIGKDALVDKKRFASGWKWSLIIAGGFALVFALIPSLAGNFSSPADSRLPQELVSSIVADRISLLRADAFRSLIFVLLTAFVVWLGFKGKLKKKYTYIALILLVFLDLWVIDKRYLSSKDFVSKEEFSSAWQQRPVDKFILDNDKDTDYRVLDLSIDPFNNSYTSYWHKTIGGYSPAKLQRYQDLIDQYIYPEIQGVINDLNGVSTLAEADSALTCHPVLSMLNTRYIILNANQPPIVNRYALGNCWFVDNVVEALDANDEIAKLNEVNPQTQAVVAKEFISKNQNIDKFVKTCGQAENDLSAAFEAKEECAGETGGALFESITLTSYAPNRLVYHYTAESDKLALFSEVYYPGWKAEINGNDADIFRANWILRGLYLPAGEGDITFTFQPDSFIKGERYSLIASSLLVLLLVGGIACVLFLKRKKQER